MAKSDRQAALDAALKAIEKQFGKGSVMKLGEKTGLDIKKNSSGSLALNKALGGGYPVGRIVEIYGPESAGKTTVTLHAVAEVQKAGGTAAFVDAEHALDPAYAQNLGVNIDELLISQPDTGEQALEITEQLVASGAVDLIVVDSVAALVPKAEIEGSMGDSHMGLQARLMSQALRKINGVVNKTNSMVIFINQVREKIGVMFGNPETTTGGRALKFYASQRLEVRRGETVKNGTEIIANNAKIKVVKNKVAPPFRDCIVQLEFGKGFNMQHEVLTLGLEYTKASGKPIINKSGSWFSYTDENDEEQRLAQGAEKSKEELIEKPELFEYLKKEIEMAMERELHPELEKFKVEEPNTDELPDDELDED